jgi:hypothetical protein
MKTIGLLAAALLMTAVLSGTASKADAQVVYYTGRPVVVYRPYYSYPVPTYSYYGGWHQGSYMNNYGNFGAYHVMDPVWTGYRYRYGW